MWLLIAAVMPWDLKTKGWTAGAVSGNGLIAHSNHIRHPHYAYQVDALGGTLYRDRRILKHLQPKAGAVTMEDIKDAFKDHLDILSAFADTVIAERQS